MGMSLEKEIKEIKVYHVEVVSFMKPVSAVLFHYFSGLCQGVYYVARTVSSAKL
jgi:hypothetical protein